MGGAGILQNIQNEDFEEQKLDLSYMTQNEEINGEDQEEIDFDQLLGDAARQQVEFDEDRDDQHDFDEDEEEELVEQALLGDSLNYTSSLPKYQQPEQSNKDDKEAEIWEYIIDKHGRKEFEAVYEIISGFKDRFSDDAQKRISEQVNEKLTPMGMTDDQV